MEFLGIGPSELVFIVIIAIIILGPKDMQKAGKTIGRWLNGFIRSDGWKALQRASKEIRNLPTNLMREANIDELRNLDKEIRQNIDPRYPTGSTVPPKVPSSNPVVTDPAPANEDTPSESAPEGSDEPKQP